MRADGRAGVRTHQPADEGGAAKFLLLLWWRGREGGPRVSWGRFATVTWVKGIGSTNAARYYYTGYTGGWAGRRGGESIHCHRG